MNKPDYQFYAIPNSVFENKSIKPYSKLLFAVLRGRECYLVSKGKCSWGEWFPLTHETMASVLGTSTESVRKTYLPELEAEGLIETRTEQGFDRAKWIPKRTCMYRILWDKILNNK